MQSSRLPTIHQKIPTSWCFVRNKRLTGKPLHKPRTNRAIRTPHNISGVEKKSPLKAWNTYSDSDLTNFSQEDIFSLFFFQESYSPQPHRWHEQLCKRKMARRGIVRWKSLGGVIRPRAQRQRVATASRPNCIKPFWQRPDNNWNSFSPLLLICKESHGGFKGSLLLSPLKIKCWARRITAE